MNHATLQELDAALEHIRRAPRNAGPVDLLVRRPRAGEREVLAEGELHLELGLVGDIWPEKPSSRTPGRSAHPDMQLNLMGSRVISVIAGHRDRWPLAGDQIYVDLDLSTANLPAGTQLDLGSARIEVTDQPHTGCAKFVERFGRDAMLFVSSPTGRELCLRGINAKVVRAGLIRPGDVLRRL